MYFYFKCIVVFSTQRPRISKRNPDFNTYSTDIKKLTLKIFLAFRDILFEG